MASHDRTSSGGSQNSSALMNLKEIKELIDLIIEKGIADFELERSGVRIKISRNAGTSPAGVLVQAAGSPLPAGTTPPHSASRPATAVAASEARAEGAQGKTAQIQELYVVRSPMVGTFYAAPGQGAEDSSERNEKKLNITSALESLSPLTNILQPNMRSLI